MQKIRDGTVHVIPLDDVRRHSRHRCCRCQPRVANDARLIIHNAYDGREFDEQRRHLQSQRGH